MNPYYGVRRLGPYLGVIQVIDVGDSVAYSADGRSWRIRQQTTSGRFRWGATLISDDDIDRVRLVNADSLVEALENKPPVPFPARDRYELWLLNRKTLSPLALLKTRYRETDMEKVEDPHWRPFALTDTRFISPTMEKVEAEQSRRGWKIPHRDQLERQVNVQSRPMPVAQWIERQADGGGIGLSGLRVDEEHVGRRFQPEDFPELLISEVWENETGKGLVEDYHNWNAALLLAHQNIARNTRQRLEKEAMKRPQDLLTVYPLIPEVLDEDAMQVALVSAKLIDAS